YGTLPPPEKTDPKQWIRKLNTTETREGLVYRYIPLSDGRGRLAGVLVLGYEISFLKANDSPLAAVVLILAMATPFVAIAFFAYWFGRRLERRISPAIDALMEGRPGWNGEIWTSPWAQWAEPGSCTPWAKPLKKCAIPFARPWKPSGGRNRDGGRCWPPWPMTCSPRSRSFAGTPKTS